jgi:hypothetical protein
MFVETINQCYLTDIKCLKDYVNQFEGGIYIELIKDLSPMGMFNKQTLDHTYLKTKILVKNPKQMQYFMENGIHLGSPNHYVQDTCKLHLTRFKMAGEYLVHGSMDWVLERINKDSKLKFFNTEDIAEERKWLTKDSNGVYYYNNVAIDLSYVKYTLPANGWKEKEDFNFGKSFKDLFDFLYNLEGGYEKYFLRIDGKPVNIVRDGYHLKISESKIGDGVESKRMERFVTDLYSVIVGGRVYKDVYDEPVRFKNENAAVLLINSIELIKDTVYIKTM